MIWSRHRKQLHWLLVIGLMSGLLVMAIDWAGGFQRLEWISQDARTQLMRTDAQVHDDLALILIDESSLTALSPVLGRFPWPRSVYADLLDFLAMGNPRAVVFDVLFTEAEWQEDGDGGLSQEDEALAMATASLGNVHHALHLHKESPDEVASDALDQPLPDIIRGQHALADVEGIPDLGRNTYLRPFDELLMASAGMGAVGLDSDADGVYRRVSPFFRYQDVVLPGLSTTALSNHLALDSARMDKGKLHLDDHAVPVDEDGRFGVNFYGEVPAYSFSGIIQSLQRLRRGEADQALIRPEEFEDRIVFLGGSAIGLHDIKHTPMSSRTPGVEIHLSAASNLLKGDYLRPLPASLSSFLILLFAVLTALGFLLSRVHYQLILPLLLLGLNTGLAVWAFGLNLLVDMVAPATAVVMSSVACMAYVSATEGRDRRRVRKMLSQYVSPAVLAEVVDRYDEHLSAEVGSSEEMTILFSDIRGFTSISEGYPADQVVTLLNRYLSELTEAIFHHEGTLDKFIGDAIMAFWGAPIRVEDHARRAVLAGLAMQSRVRHLNTALAEEGQPLLHTGIGLHTGQVILGNIGSERKLDYTVIGDNVNLASRIEGLTSHYGCPLLISGSSYEALGEDIICALVDRVRVKGKQQAVSIWRPLAGPEDDSETQKRARAVRLATEAAWACYERRDWAGAIQGFEALPVEDPIRRIFLGRCSRYAEQDVPEDWDGVYRLDTK